MTACDIRALASALLADMLEAAEAEKAASENQKGGDNGGD